MRAALFLWLLCATTGYGQPLSGTVLILDPGHGDRGFGRVPSDPGAGAETRHGHAWECVFTWDTSMRLKRLAESFGAQVFLTLGDPRGDYEPKPWAPDSFPEPGSAEFPYRTLVDRPERASVHDALLARVEFANRIYREYRGRSDILFLSLHFDSTSPTVEGISFYYAPGCGSNPFVNILENRIRSTGRMRSDVRTGWEHGLSQPHPFAVLAHSENPDSYLIELGNIRSCNDEGGNPDLWRMRHPEIREEYARLMADALVDLQTGSCAPADPYFRTRYKLALALIGACLGLVIALSRRRRRPADRS